MKLSKDAGAGFTLVELVIVIAILIILAGVVISTLNIPEYLREARDAKRVSDILGLQKAILSSVADNSIRLTNTSGCGDCDSIAGTREVDGTGWVKYQKTKGAGLEEFIVILPSDPINDGELRLSYQSDGSFFEISAKLESQKYSALAVNDGGDDINTYERGTF
ncbi:hypothetical protein HYW61_00200 [candidate division WWE3 bacterium]|nr:hypothetical protein [candidate division WWE3 bacterium]